MAWKDPRTTSPEKSIWRDLPEDTFRQHLVELEAKTNSIPIDPQVFSPEEWLATSARESHGKHILPLPIEQQLANDFAFLAAVSEGAQSVAAVCLEQHKQSLTLRFATLDSFLSSSIKNSLQSITQTLSENASTTSSPQEKGKQNPRLDNLLDLVITLHQNRLLARLRSSKWQKPTYLSKSHKKPLWADLPNLLHRAQHLYSKPEKHLLQSVSTKISSLSTTYSAFESTTPDTLLPSLNELVKKSYDFCSLPEIHSFTERLTNSQIARKPTPQIASAIKALRQIEKIASYRRIGLSLLSLSSKYSELFKEIEICYLEPYKAVPTEIGYEEWGRRCHVHAEVQLVVYYDLVNSKSSTSSRPRCIGTSKHLCYLCYLFLLHHASFFPSRTHGRLYDQWTIPDLEEFSEKMVNKYRCVIRGVDDEVVGRSEGEGELWRLMPMTSVDSGPFLGEG